MKLNFSILAISLLCTLTFLGNVSAMEPVYKILREKEWKEFNSLGYFAGNSDDQRDGFIHLSPANQIQRIINKYFSNDRPLYILKFDDSNFLEKLVWEEAGSGGLYPHLYHVPLRLEDLRSYETMK